MGDVKSSRHRTADLNLKYTQRVLLIPVF